MLKRTGALLLGLLATLPGCSFLRPAKAPMPSLSLSGPERTSRSLIVLLPGRRNGPDAYETAGFASLAAEAGIDADLLAVDAHFGYYRTRSLVTRLRADVILPARQRGYEHIWLVGVSLGAVGSLLYTMNHPDEVAGVALFAPYLGEPKQVRQIAADGGLHAWSPRPSQSGFPWEMWIWAKAYEDRSTGLPPVWLGFGTEDGFAAANRLFAEALPAERVMPIPGGHDWPTWTELWERFVQAAPLPRRAE